VSEQHNETQTLRHISETQSIVSLQKNIMKKLLLIIPVLFILQASAQTIIKQDAAIKQMVDEVSSKILKQTSVSL
jgi:type III secretory pathway component EscU